MLVGRRPGPAPCARARTHPPYPPRRRPRLRLRRRADRLRRRGAGRRSHAVADDSSTAPALRTAHGATPTARPHPTIPDFDAADWESVRAQFPLDPAMAQFAAFVLSPHTAQVDAAIDFHRSRLALDTEGTLLGGIELEDAVRRRPPTTPAVTPGQYALTDSTTMGIAQMYGGLSLEPGDEVLSTTHDFFSTEESLRLLDASAPAPGSERVTLYDEPWQATVDEMVSRLIAGVTPRTKVVAVTWVHSSTGRPAADPGDQRALDGRRAALRRRRARLRGGRRRPARPRLRLPVRRHPQVAVRPAGHRHPVGPRLGAAHRADPVVLRVRAGRPALPRRLPRLRAPLGPRPGLRVPPEGRSRGRRPAHRRRRPPSSRRDWPARRASAS